MMKTLFRPFLVFSLFGTLIIQSAQGQGVGGLLNKGKQKIRSVSTPGSNQNTPQGNASTPQPANGSNSSGASGNAGNSGSGKGKDDGTYVPVSLDFDYRKNQWQYFKEFMSGATEIYELQMDYADKVYVYNNNYNIFGRKGNRSFFFRTPEEVPSGKSVYENKDLASQQLFYYFSPDGDFTAYYTNYDKGPGAWVRYSDKTRIEENHGEGKKYTDQEALDYGVGWMFFTDFAFKVSYKRYDGGTRYVVEPDFQTIYTTSKKAGYELNKELLTEKVMEYLVKGENEPDGFILGLSNQLHAEDKAKNSIEGKQVKAIKIKTGNGETKVPLNYAIKLEFEATLEDGTVMSTAQKAWMDDYIIEISGGTLDKDGNLMCYQFTSGDDFDLQQVKDEVSITITSKYHPDLGSTTLKLPVDYTQPKLWELNYAGNPFNNQWGGASLVVEVKKVKNTVDGSDLLEYRLRYKRDAHWFQVVRIRPENSLFLNCSGFSHGSKTSGDGKNGGDGGDIRLIVDPSVSIMNFDFSNKGAKAQPPKSSAYAYGQNGRDGTFQKTVQKVNW
jgi:hypothetical protein